MRGEVRIGILGGVAAIGIGCEAVPWAVLARFGATLCASALRFERTGGIWAAEAEPEAAAAAESEAEAEAAAAAMSAR